MLRAGSQSLAQSRPVQLWPGGVRHSHKVVGRARAPAGQCGRGCALEGGEKWCGRVHTQEGTPAKSGTPMKRGWWKGLDQ